MLGKKTVAVLELLLAAAIWGMGFVATIWALRTVDAFELSVIRFVLAGMVGLPVLIFGPARKDWKILLSSSFIPARLLAALLLFQTWGLEFTSATKSGFITTLYVVFVPLLEVARRKRRMPPLLWVCVFIALVGTGLIVDIGFSEVNFGDVLTFICAIFATFQIYWLGKISKRIKRPFAFNMYQSVWALVFCLPWVNFDSCFHKLIHIFEWPTLSIIGICELAFGSTILAFSLQLRAQARLSPTVSSLMFLLESPFALVFSIIFLDQILRPLEMLGAVLISAAAIFAVTLEEQTHPH